MNELDCTISVIKIEDAGWYADGNTSGSTVRVTLEREYTDGTVDVAQCDGILYWEECEQEDMMEYFAEWVAMAIDGETGYKALIDDDGVKTYYNTDAAEFAEFA